jgi:hypothetical protein
MADDAPERRTPEEEPDPRLVWRWVAKAARPWFGWVLIGAAALLMLLGYLGVSREAIVGKQIPYLVSGGIGGVLLAVLGAYFLGTEELRRDSGRLDRLERMIEELHAVLLRRDDAPDPDVARRGDDHAQDDTEVSSNGARRAPRRVLAVADAELFHRAGCAMVADKEADELTVAAARKRGLQPCPVCEPAPAPA